MGRRAFVPLALVVALSLALPAHAQEVRLSIANGRATLHAVNATPAAILAEWARLGGTRIVDAERLTAASLTLTLENVPEREALDIVLRSAAGYIAAARPAGAPGASAFDRIIVMPVSVNASAARGGPAPAPATTPLTPVMAQPFDPPVQVEGQASEGQMVADDGTVQVEQPVSSTEFDYANPQRYFAARAAQQRAAAEAAAEQNAVADDEAGAQAPVGPGGLSMGTLLSAPGTIPTPPAQRPGQGGAAPPANPYGLPADAAPGSSSAPPMEPDRSKYINPYAPTPQPPQP